MRIGMILSTPIPAQEGIGFYVSNLSRQLQKLGHQVTIITRGEPNKPEREQIDGLTVYRPRFVPVYPLHTNIHGHFVDQLIRQIDDEIDLYHVHTPLVQVPRTRKPIVATVHTPMKTDTRAVALDSMLGLMVKLQAPFSFRVERALFKRADALASVSNSVAQEMQEYNIDPQDVMVLGNGVETSVFYATDASKRARQENPNPYALTVARLAPRKGLSDLIDCAKIVRKTAPNFRFLIAGSGPEEERLRTKLQREGLANNVVLLGHIESRTDLLDLYRNAAMFVHPAHYEGLPTVLLEAMACGCPAVATAVSGALDVVNHEQNGLLVGPKNPSQLADGILRLIEQPRVADQLGHAAQMTIRDRYAWHIIAQSYIKQYKAFVPERRMRVESSTLAPAQ